MLRKRDLLAWQPHLTSAELRSWEALDLIHPFRKTKTAHRYYKLSEIKKVLNLL